jgi:RNA polymerase sigma-70 factor (ECF subfamily)
MLTAAETTAPADVDLIRRLKAGDEDAYAAVVRTLGGRMLSVARRFLRDEEAARDAVQDAFLSAFRGIHAFDGEAELATWLHRIVVNAALMKLRTRRRKPEESIEPMLPAFAEDGHHATRPVTAWAMSAEQALLRRETRERVRAAIAELPESYRTVLLLRDIEERSTREAANLVGVSENALKLRLHRARQALATKLLGRAR